MGKSLALGTLALTLAAGSFTAARHWRQPAARHDGFGVVLAAAQHGQIRISHEAFAGYMPAMSMTFEIRGGETALVAGDRVRFALRVTSERSWIEDVTVVGHGDTGPGDRAPSAGVLRLHEGDRLPPLALVDQDGAPLTAQDLDGGLTVLTFIFTRCPVPD